MPTTIPKTPREMTKTVFVPRVEKAAAAIARLVNCANPRYEYEADEVDRAFEHLHNVLNRTKQKFERDSDIQTTFDLEGGSVDLGDEA